MNSKILIVEDNQKILFNLKLLLKHKGYHPITATNGVEALEILSNLGEAPDLILCDIMMPKMDGYEFYQKVSENPEWNLTPFIFITAKTDPDDVRFAKKLGIDDYVIKPFKEEDLLASIAGKIQRSKKHKSWSEKIQKKLLSSLQIDTGPSISDEDEKKDAIRRELFKRKRILESICKQSMEDRRIIKLEILVIAEDTKDRMSGRN